MRAAGLYTESNSDTSFPLKSATCHYRLVDVQVLASLIQEYISDSLVDESVSYVFPLPPDSGVCLFKAIINDERVIRGLVKEKGVAKADYIEAVAKGKTAALLEKRHPDGKRVSLSRMGAT